MYIDAAVESADFIQSHLLTPSNIVLARIFSDSSQSLSCVVDSRLALFDSGLFIEGLVILAEITHNASTEALYVPTDLL